MDPVTAIGLASGILAFVTFSTKLVKGAIKIHDATDGHLEDNRSRELVVQEMKKLSAKLLAPDDSALVGEEKGLCLLATECQKLSTDLIALLERIKPKNPSSKAQSLWSALKNAIHDKEKTDLEQRLDRCRGQLELHITFLTTRETRASLHSILSVAKTDRTTLLRLQRNIEHLSQGIEVSFISEKAQEQLKKLVGVQEEVLNAITQQRILRALSFPGMNARYNMVDDPYTRTFEWIFGDAYPVANGDEDNDGGDNDNDQDDHKDEKESSTFMGESLRCRNQKDIETDKKAIEMKRQARERFTKWLSSEDGIFHISGKLGSGKSTLMRFLYEHRGTRAELERWAGNRLVVLAGFFFWNPGTDLQKSLAGLFRALLHSMLQQCPNFIHQLFPEYWDEICAGPWQVDFTVEIPDKEIRRAFNRLIRNKAFYENHCFCLFIDGLDEYQETARYDRKSMVDLLCSWTRVSEGQVKLCVSSREDNVFMNSFSSYRRFRLQELTRNDMARFVRSKLKHLPDSKSKEQLIDAIPQRAQGIFLWVSLVSKSMREELENGASVDSLWEMLEKLPEELHDLFEHLLRSLNETGRRRAYRTMTMLLLSKKHDIQFSVLGYSFFEAYERDHEFAVGEDFQRKASTVRGNDGFITERNSLGQKQLNGWCKGLLEVLPEQSWGPALIDYTHRSIAEFLETDRIKTEMTHCTERFNSVEALSQLFLAAQAHFPDGNSRKPPKRPGYLPERQLSGLMRLRRTAGLDLEPPFAFLECVGSLRSLDQWRFLEPGIELLRVQVAGSADINYDVHFLAIQRLEKVKNKEGLGNRHVEHPFLIAASMKNNNYIRWALTNHPEIFVSDPNIMALFTYVLLCYTGDFQRWDTKRVEPDWEFLDSYLLREGLINLHARTPLWPYAMISYFEVRAGMRLLPKEGDWCFNMTIWEHILARGFLIWLFPSRRADDGVYFGRMCEMLLRHGAGNPSLSATVRVKSNELHREEVTVTFEADVDGEPKSASFWHSNREFVHKAGHFVKQTQGLKFRDVSEWDVVDGEPCKTFSLRSWIEYCTYDEVPNRDRLLQLLDQEAGKSVTVREPAFLNGSRMRDHTDSPKRFSRKHLCGSKEEAETQTSSIITSPSTFVHTNHTPSSIFGFLLAVLIFMVYIEMLF